MKKTFKSMFAFMLVAVMTVALFGAMASADALVNVKFVDEDGNPVSGAAAVVPETAEALAEKGVELVPGTGMYVASVKVGEKSVMSCVEADLESTKVVVDFAADEEDDGLTLTAGMTLVVTVAEIPEEIEFDSYAATLYGSHVFATGAASVTEKDGEYTVYANEEGVAGAQLEGMVVILANGAVVEIEDGDSFEAVIPFKVKSTYTVGAVATIAGPFSRENPIPEAIDQTDENGVNVKADVAAVDGAFEFSNIVVTIGEDELEEDEYVFFPAATLTDPIKTNLTITAPTVNAVYNGEALTITSSPIISGLQGKDMVTDVKYKALPAVPGKYDVEIESYKIVDEINRDVSGYYEVTLTKGTATIEKAPVKVAAKDCTAEYDGTAHTANDYEIVSGQLFGEDKLTVTYEGTATNVEEGKKASIIGTAAVEGANAGCYDVQIDNTKGSITITARPITLTVKNATAGYTGKEITATNVGADLTSGSYATGDALASITTSGKGTSVGDTAINGSDVVIKNGTTDVTKNYNITVVPGKLTITPSSTIKKGTVTITFSGSKVYDGTALTQTYTVEIDSEAKKTVGAVKVDGATVGPDAVTKYMTDADVTITLIGTDGKTELNKAEYNVKVVPGNVIISKQPITIKPSDATKKYDGAAYVGKISGTKDFNGSKLAVKANALPYSGSTQVQGIAVGTYTLKVDPSSVFINDAKGNDITANFDCTFGEATLKVTATIGTANYSKSAGGTVTINATLPRADLASVVVDGKTLIKDTDYTISTSSSNTVITFKNEFLKTLSEGTHSVVYYYNTAGSISTNLTVSATGSTTSTQAAQTGDSSNMTLWIVIAAIVLAAIVAIVVVLLKQKKSQIEG